MRPKAIDTKEEPAVRNEELSVGRVTPTRDPVFRVIFYRTVYQVFVRGYANARSRVNRLRHTRGCNLATLVSSQAVLSQPRCSVQLDIFPRCFCFPGRKTNFFCLVERLRANLCIITMYIKRPFIAEYNNCCFLLRPRVFFRFLGCGKHTKSSKWRLSFLPRAWPSPVSYQRLHVYAAIHCPTPCSLRLCGSRT